MHPDPLFPQIRLVIAIVIAFVMASVMAFVILVTLSFPGARPPSPDFNVGPNSRKSMSTPDALYGNIEIGGRGGRRSGGAGGGQINNKEIISKLINVIYLPPPIWQKLSARRWVNFQVAYPEF